MNCLDCGCSEFDHIEDDKGQCNNCIEGFCQQHGDKPNRKCEVCNTHCEGFRGMYE